MKTNNSKTINALSNLLEQKGLAQIRDTVQDIKSDVQKLSKNKNPIRNIARINKSETVNSKYLIGELDQILKTRTIERTKYYIQRLIRALSETKTGKMNDLNLHKWKEYDDILIDSLWVFKDAMLPALITEAIGVILFRKFPINY